MSTVEHWKKQWYKKSADSTVFVLYESTERQNIYFRQKHGRQTTFQLFMFDPESIPEQDQALEKSPESTWMFGSGG